MSDGGRKAASSGEGTVNVTPGTEKKEKEEIGRKKGEEEEEHRDANEYDGGDGSAKENVAPSMKDLFEYAKKNRWRFAMVMKSVNLENSPPRWDEEERKKEEKSCVEELLSGMKVQSAELVVNHEQTHTVTVFYGENRESFEFELSLSGFVEEFLEKVKAYGSDRGRMSPLLPEQSKCFLKILIECQCFEDVECAIDGIDDSFGSANTMNRYLSLMEELVKEQLYNRDPIVKFDMVHEGQPHGPGLVVFGLFCRATFIAFLQKILRAHEDVSFANLVGADARKTLLVVGIMTAHSFGEGSGVGVSFSGVHGENSAFAAADGVGGVPGFPGDEKSDDKNNSSCGVKSLTVGPNPGEFETISKALDASAKEGGATIEIKSGTYKERILMNKDNVKLVGLSDDVFVEWRTSTPYESVLEVTSENASVENVKFTHASKSVANNFGVFVKEKGSLKLKNVSVTSETGSGVATEGGSIDAENVVIDKCKNHGVSAFGNQSEDPKSGQVHLKNVAISNCGGDGILLRGGVQIDSLDVKIDNCTGFGVDAFENVQGTMKACKISKCRKGNVGGDNDNYDGNGVGIELV
ncbi:unnamed protein product [Bathycoccus prasinos]